MIAAKRQAELEYLKDKREKLYEQPISFEKQYEIGILTEKINEILNERW